MKAAGNSGRVFVYHAKDDDGVARSHALLREADGMGHAFDGGECEKPVKDLRASA